ncbi:hypothetical protein B6U99_04035 [Candidatus Geothermarchaeota archaeon ex4572_27]|nr:MAG: hypothetical protein B6U99_04035 [Candidatus Geothermarchaeota archaeon ex4572_27]
MRAIYGPVASWRLGLSLGVDLLGRPKTCTFNCVYCQLGPTVKAARSVEDVDSYIEPEELRRELLQVRGLLDYIDWITISGVGEPTLSPKLRDSIKAIREVVGGFRLAILTNSSLLWSEGVRRALDDVDLIVAKLDAADDNVLNSVNRPALSLRASDLASWVKLTAMERGHGVALQVMLVKGLNDGEDHLLRLAELARHIEPEVVYLGTPIRPTQEPYAKPLGPSRLRLAEEVFRGVGLKVRTPMRPLEASASRPLRPLRVLETLARRPCRAIDLARSMGVEVEEVVEALRELEARGLVRAKVYEGEVYYEASFRGS